MFGNKNDDLKLFNNIYHKYKDIINYWIATRVKEKSHHEDIFQEVLLKLYTHVREYDISKGNLKNWIYTITTSCIRDYYKTYINKEGKNYIDDLSVLRDETYDEHTKMRDIKHILSSYEYDIFVCYFIFYCILSYIFWTKY